VLDKQSGDARACGAAAGALLMIAEASDLCAAGCCIALAGLKAARKLHAANAGAIERVNKALDFIQQQLDAIRASPPSSAGGGGGARA